MAALLVGGCRSGRADDDRALAARLDEGPSGRSIAVPGDRPSVAAALAVAGPGDLILLAPGVYRERVEIDTPRIVLRGIDRNAVVFDGDDRLDVGIVVRADGVVIENLTVRNYRDDGILVDGDAIGRPSTVAGAADDLAVDDRATATRRTADAGDGDDADDDDDDDDAGERVVDGYRISHVTAYANGGSGIRARRARGGLVEASLARGHPGAGVAVEACRPCDTVVTGSTGEVNGAGFRAVNAAGGLYVVSSTWRDNRVGVVVRAEVDAGSGNGNGDGDGGGGGRAAGPAIVLAGNLVAGNANADAPLAEDGPFGVGVLVSGPSATHVVRNRVTGHFGVGVAVTDLDGHPPRGNEVRDNAVEGNATDLAFYLVGVASDDTADNCFAANSYARALPNDVEAELRCRPGEGGSSPGRGVRFPAPRLPATPPEPAAPVPPPVPQAQLPVVTAPARPATGEPPPVDVDSLVIPIAAR